jgi:hypothetical protein
LQATGRVVEEDIQLALLGAAAFVVEGLNVLKMMFLQLVNQGILHGVVGSAPGLCKHPGDRCLANTESRNKQHGFSIRPRS